MDADEQRAAAIKRIKAKREYKTALVAYVVVNLFLVGVWYFSGQGYFWPAWVMLGWGMGMVIYGWNVYKGERPITEDDIQKEIGGSG
ncbi:MAG: 2TM domain-containing protein [Acidimicrobiia bacterium]